MDWKTEACAVIEDVKPYVSSIKIARDQKSCDMRIYFDIETLELQKFVVSMDSNGFSICDNDQNNGSTTEASNSNTSPSSCNRYDQDQQNETKIYETINALLDDNSVEYRKAFAQALLKRMKSLENLEGPR